MTVSYKLLAIPKNESNFIQLGKTVYKSIYEEGHSKLIKSLLKPFAKEFKEYDYVFLFVSLNSEEFYRYATIQLFPKPYKRFSISDIMNKIREQFSARIQD